MAPTESDCISLSPSFANSQHHRGQRLADHYLRRAAAVVSGRIYLFPIFAVTMKMPWDLRILPAVASRGSVRPGWK